MIKNSHYPLGYHGWEHIKSINLDKDQSKSLISLDNLPNMAGYSKHNYLLDFQLKTTGEMDPYLVEVNLDNINTMVNGVDFIVNMYRDTENKQGRYYCRDVDKIRLAGIKEENRKAYNLVLKGRVHFNFNNNNESICTSSYHGAVHITSEIRGNNYNWINVMKQFQGILPTTVDGTSIQIQTTGNDNHMKLHNKITLYKEIKY